MVLKVLRWTGLTLLALVMLFMASSCTMLGLNYSSLETGNKPEALPPLPAGLVAGDETAREEARALLAALYGDWPEGLPVAKSPWRVVVEDYLGGRGTLEEADITIGRGEGARTFQLVAAFPKGARGAPLVLSQTFGSNCATFPEQPVTSEDGDACTVRDFGKFASMVISAVFGEYIAEAPVELYFDAGFAYASFHASDFIPDDAKTARPAMEALGGAPNPGGALMAWAYAYSAALGVLADDPRIDGERVALLGHSRFGKAALLAAAWDARIAAVIAHQSGFGGAALSRSTVGERLDRMIRRYPHWLGLQAAAFAEYPEAMDFDQHFLLALMAPRPLFLGNARRDVWSDPNSSFRAAEAASAAWRAQGAAGLALDIREFDPSAKMAWFLRPGGHSVTDDDLEAFLAFLTAHLTRGGALPRAAMAP
ncbi:hypothetical protein [Hyphomonas sp.]|uniref:glucuronyl esterase domain-containing protein n=1 Tax=Hyphomonas sp. TaxID=87 RepID=UPI00391C0048